MFAKMSVTSFESSRDNIEEKKIWRTIIIMNLAVTQFELSAYLYYKLQIPNVSAFRIDKLKYSLVKSYLIKSQFVETPTYGPLDVFFLA